jgi:hypothetical protein
MGGIEEHGVDTGRHPWMRSAWGAGRASSAEYSSRHQPIAAASSLQRQLPAGRPCFAQADDENRVQLLSHDAQGRLGDARAVQIIGVNDGGLKVADMLRQAARQPPPRELAGAIQRQRQMMAAGARKIAGSRSGRRHHKPGAAAIVHGPRRGDDVAGQRADAELRYDLQNHGVAYFRAADIGGNRVVESSRDGQSIPLW